jgi:acyl transferase domain-containing protein/thioesterase domain-containing protein/acyl carrier protein
VAQQHQTADAVIEPGCIAIVGLAGHFPAARSAAELWSLLKSGQPATEWLNDEQLRAAGVPEADLTDPSYVRASLVLPDMEMFDAEFFGFSQRDASVMDPQHRHFLECAWEALEDAGHMPEQFDGSVGVFAGCGMQAYLPQNLLTNPALVKSMGLFLLRHTGNDKDFLTTRLSYLLDLKGPSIAVQTACSTSLVAVHLAVQSLLSGECDMALAGGVSINLPHRHGYHYTEGEILSPDGLCRAFDEEARGTIFGSGVGVVVLRRLEDALQQGDHIYAVIRGSAVNNDGSQKAGYLAPSVEGQAGAAVEALAMAGVEPSSIQYIEAHGTGTPVGDPIEVAALAQAYAGLPGTCGIGSLKTHIGHLDTAAGVSALIKVSLALRHELIPESLNFSQPNSRLAIETTPFYVVDKARPWPHGSTPRRAAVNALGVGGTNAHVILEEAPVLAVRPESGPVDAWQLLTLSARSPAALQRLRAKWQAFLAQPADDFPADFSLADAAYTLRVGRRDFAHRLALVAQDLSGLREVLQARHAPRVVTAQASATPPPVVLMFPGGGAHYPGAGRDLLALPVFREAIDACMTRLPADTPEDLRSVMLEGVDDPQTAALLQRPRYAMPALFILEYALAKLWQSWGVKPAAIMGHSAGEYAAACLAGVMSLEEALSVVVLRGQLFEAVPAGSMLSVDLSEAELLNQMAGLELDVAAVNGPDNCIASGSLSAIETLQHKLASQGLGARRLHIDVAAHSRLLDGVLEVFRQRMKRIRLQPPNMPFISNLTGTWVAAETLTDPEYWVKHLRQTVRFSNGLDTLLQMPDAVLLEVGPGQGLCALARNQAQDAQRGIRPSTGKAEQANEGRVDLPVMLTAAAGLWTRGVAIDWPALLGARTSNATARRTSLPTYAFERQRHWVDAGVPMPMPMQMPMPAQAVAEVQPTPVFQRLPDYADWLQVPEWMPSVARPDTAQPGRHWLVFGSESKLTADVILRVLNQGDRVTLVRPGSGFASLIDGSFTVTAADALRYAQVFRSLEQSRALPDFILHLWALDADLSAAADAHECVPGQTLVFDSLLFIAKALQDLDCQQPMRLTVLTAGSQALPGEMALNPNHALALGPCRVIPHELPNLRTRLMDCLPTQLNSKALPRLILAECMSADEADLVVYRGQQRRVRHLVKAAPSAAAVSTHGLRAPLRQRGVYLITGGLGAIALELAEYLACTQQAKLVLLSRRALPARAAWQHQAALDDGSDETQLLQRLLDLEAAGAEILTLSADVQDPVAMARAVAESRAHFGALHGVFHAAGVLEDGAIHGKSAESIRRVLGAKAAGAQVLHALLPPGSLDFLAVFSSTSVVLGGAGQVDYVAANAFVDSLAASRPDGLCIHWGIWGDRGMAQRAYGGEGLRAPQASSSAISVHPLLGVRHDTAENVRFEAVYTPSKLWVLNEHKVAGRPVLVGTAFIEIARAAMQQLHPGHGLELQALSFGEAMVFDGNAPRDVSIELLKNATGYDFRVCSRPQSEAPWQEHARAGISLFEGALPAASALPAVALRPGDWVEGRVPQTGVMAFGPRWQNITRMQLNGQGGTAEIELPTRFAPDLIAYACHPAMLDMAATFGLHLLGSQTRQALLFVPLSIERIRLVAALPGQCVSRVELSGPLQNRMVTFDVNLHASDGSPLATLEGLCMRGVSADTMTSAAPARAAKAPTLVASMLACGIRGDDAPVLFDRIFANDARDLTVSSMALPALQLVLQRALVPAKPPLAARGTELNASPRDASLSPVERVMVTVWRELLGTSEIDRDDDFFALGGHSLAAVRLFARIRKELGVDLPLATLFKAPTLGALSVLVEQARSRAAVKESEKGVEDSWSALVEINRGRAGVKPLFCVHGAAGNVLNFKTIADRLGADQPFYGLQAQGVDGRLPLLPSIEAMAAQYVAAIRTVDAVGPYRLAGYSGGGLIALEMAQQLKQSGAEVVLLAMLDTLSPAAARVKIPALKKIWLMRHWSLKFAMEWPERRRTTQKERANHALALQQLSAGQALPPELASARLYSHFVAAQERYQTPVYDGAMVLFRAQQGYTPYLNAGPKLGWQTHLCGHIRVVEIPGSHVSMLTEPGLSTLAQGLRQELARVDAPRDMSSGLDAPVKSGFFRAKNVAA